MRAALILSFGAVVHAAAGSAAGAQNPARFPLRVTSVQVAGGDLALGSAPAGRVAGDGRVYITDYLNARVVALSAEGRTLWTRGRKGRGPGEFQLPYRLDVAADGRVLVLDLGAGEITALSPGGDYIARYRLPFAFDQIDNLVQVATGDIVIAGTTRGHAAARGKALHRMEITGGTLKYVASFGPLPEVRDTLVLQSWGAGSLSRTSEGDLLYTRRVPYEVYRYDRAGRLKSVVRPPFRTRGVPDDAIRVERHARGYDLVLTRTEIEQPGTAVALPGGRLLVTRSRGESRFWDAFSAGGEFLGSLPLPQGWGGIVGVDARRRVIWIYATRELEPVLMRVNVVW